MKKERIIQSWLILLTSAIVLHTSVAKGQGCNEAILATKGNWKKVKIESRVPGTDGLNRTKFLESVHQLFQPYKPSMLEARPYFIMSNTNNGEPVNLFTYEIMAHEYYCFNGAAMCDGKASTRLDVMFNQFVETPLYDTSNDYILTGYFDLRHGLPVEVKPGIWEFPTDDQPIDHRRNGKSKLWLIGFDGELPWTYVTRREFLVKRKRNLQYMLSSEDGHLKEQLDKWNYEKKYKEEELKNDVAKLSKYVDNIYKPGIEREQQNFKRSTQNLQKAIEKVEGQLTEPALDKQAIVIKSQTSTYDYSFTDKVEPFAEVLTKPNPAYFRRKLSPSIAQFISVELIYDHENVSYTRFAQSIETLLDLNVLKSFIGKSVPGGPAIKAAATQKEVTAPARANNVSEKKKTETPVKNHANTKLVASANVSPAPATGKPYTLSGPISVPSGSAFTRESHGTTDLDIGFPKSPGFLNSSKAFSFSKTVDKNAVFNLMVKKIPANMKAAAYVGKGTVPNGEDQLKAAVDYTFKLVRRSCDNTISGFYESGDIAIGGYNGEEGRYNTTILVSKLIPS